MPSDENGHCRVDTGIAIAPIAASSPKLAPISGRDAVGPGARRRTIGSGAAPVGVRLSLLGELRLAAAGVEVALRRGSARLLALLALRRAHVRRDLVAGLFWPGVSEQAAHTCLRQALARAARDAPLVVRATGDDLSLAEGVSVDLYDAQRIAAGLLRSSSRVDLGSALDHVGTLSKELLPGWYEDWALVEAESWRQLRLHALDTLASALCAQERFGEASVAAAAAIGADPLRETARTTMISIHIAEGNHSEARREFERYRSLVRRELGCEPSARLENMVAVS